MYFSIFYLTLGLLALLGVGDAAPHKHPTRKHRFDRFHLYAEFVAASGVTGNCNSPPNGASVFHYINQQSTDTQATIFIDQKRREIIFSSPGSVSSQDWANDYNTKQVSYNGCQGCMVHGGFYNAWQSIQEETHTSIREALNQHPGFKVVTSGYSLGAAVAALAWTSLKDQGMPVYALYTFGQPRIGNPAFAAHIDQMSGAGDHSAGGYFRVIHNADPVPNWPAQWDGYQQWRHPLTQYWESGESVQAAETTFRCYGQEPEDCSLGAQSAPNGNDHLLYSNVYFANAAQYCGL